MLWSHLNDALKYIKWNPFKESLQSDEIYFNGRSSGSFGARILREIDFWIVLMFSFKIDQISLSYWHKTMQIRKLFFFYFSY